MEINFQLFLAARLVISSVLRVRPRTSTTFSLMMPFKCVARCSWLLLNPLQPNWVPFALIPLFALVFQLIQYTNASAWSLFPWLLDLLQMAHPPCGPCLDPPPRNLAFVVGAAIIFCKCF